MISRILKLMEIDDFYGHSKTIDIAKGKHELTINIEKLYKQSKRKWLRKEQ